MNHKPFLIVAASNPLRGAISGAGGERPFIHDLEARLRDDRPDCFEALRRRAAYRPTLAERIGNLVEENALPALLGFATGMTATVGLAFIWSLFL